MTPTLITLVLAFTPHAQAQDADAEAQWQLQHLELRPYEQVVAELDPQGPLTAMPITATPLSEYSAASLERWGIFRGDGTQLDALDFAQLVGDSATLTMLEESMNRSRTRGWLAVGVGVAAMGGCTAMLGVSSQQDDPSMALSAVGAGMGLAGLVSTTAGLRVAIAPRKLHGGIDAAWTPSEAEELLRTYNREMRQDLGLPVE